MKISRDADADRLQQGRLSPQTTPAWSGPLQESLLTLINDILDFSRFEAGKFELETIDFKLRGCIEPTLKSLAVRAHQKGLELNCSFDPDVPDALLRGRPQPAPPGFA